MRSILALFLFAGVSWGQSVKLPAEVKVSVGRLASVVIDWDGDDLKFDVPPEIDAFREYDPDPKKVRLRLIGYTPGKHRLIAIAVKDKKLTDFVSCTVLIGDPVPPDPKPPDPKPPDPKPPTPPAPIPEAGFRVLIVYDNPDSLTREQLVAINSRTFRDYVNSKCVKVNNQPEWRSYDKDARGIENESMVWQKAFKRPRTTLPWILISDGKTGTEEPLPKDLDDLMALLKKFGGQ